LDRTLAYYLLKLKNYNSLAFQLRILFLIAFLFYSSFLSSQHSGFSKLEKAEKLWALRHPFAALRIKNSLPNCLSFVEQVKKQKLLDEFENGGCLDAFRHVFTMAFLSQRISVFKLRSLGIAHEKANREQFKKGILENNELPDSVSCKMDLLNNEIGFLIGDKFPELEADSLVKVVLNEINNQGAWQIKRNEKGNYVRCDGKEIQVSELGKVWEIPKCLIRTNNNKGN
jgi:hypothetical protein